MAALAISLAVIAFVAIGNVENDIRPPEAAGGGSTNADTELDFDDAMAAAPTTSLKTHGISKQIRSKGKQAARAVKKVSCHSLNGLP